ncbi:MAG: response regulator transcription factor [Chitinophagaceae bacterium]
MIRVAIVEDNLSYLQALRFLISRHKDLLLVYSAESLINPDPLYKSKPDVIILDIDLPERSGIESVPLLKLHLPEAGIFMLTVFEDDDKIFNSIKAGAQGYLLKKDNPERIIEAIHAVYNGESIMNGKIARKVLEYFNKPVKSRREEMEKYNLTKREKEILDLIIEGLPHKVIAERCNISMHTLFTHTRNIYSKLNMHSRAEIASHFH